MALSPLLQYIHVCGVSALLLSAMTQWSFSDQGKGAQTTDDIVACGGLYIG